MLALPWADHLQELFVFIALDRGVDLNKICPQHLAKRCVFLQQIQRVGHIGGDIVAVDIGVGLEFGAGLLFLHQAKVAAGQRGCDAEIGVAIHPRQAVFDAPRRGGRDWHPQPCGAVVAAPFKVNRGCEIGHIAAVAVHIGRKQGDGAGQVILHARDAVQKRLGLFAFFVREDVLAGFAVDHRGVDMHG